MCLFATVRAQQSYFFKQYTVEDGFQQNTISSILQDHKGLMWFATWDGIYRFDGYSFRNYKNSVNPQSHFLSNRILSIKEDTFGFIWALGYDNRISRLNTHKEDISAVLKEDEYVKDYFVLPNGQTWLITEHNGLILYTTNPKDQEIQPRNISQELNLSTNSKDYHKVFADNDGNSWLLTGMGLYRYTENDSIYFPIPIKQAFLDMQEGVEYLYFASENGEVWKYHKATGRYEILQLPVRTRIINLQLLTSGKLCCGTETDGFFLMNTDGKEKQHFSTATHKVMSDNAVRLIYEDAYGELWIQQKANGVTHFNPQTGEMRRYEIHDRHGNLITDGRYPQIIVEDSYGNLYIHPTGGGFASYDRKNKKLVPLYNKQLLDGWRDSDLVMFVYMDRQDNVWLSSQSNGIEKIASKSEHFAFHAPPQLRQEQINNRSVFMDREGRTWVGYAHRGIGVYDKNHQFLGYLQKDGTLSKTKNTLRIRANTIVQDHEGTIWMGFKKYGVMALTPGKQPNTFTISHFLNDEKDIFSLSYNDVFHIFEDDEQRMWFVTLLGGINYLEKAEDGTYRFINWRNKLKNYPVKISRTRHMITDHNGKLWLATTDGIFVFDEKFENPSKLQFENIKNESGNPYSLGNSDVQFILKTKRGEIYAATFGGGFSRLLSYEHGEAKFKTYTQQDGLLSDILLSMIEDAQGNIWIVAAEGLSKFNPETEQFENFSTKDFPESIRFNDGVGYYSQENATLMLNTQQGLLCFNPETVNKSAYIPPIVISQLQLSDKVITPGDATHILSSNIDEISKLVLSHKQKSFSIRFAAIDMTNPHNISYMYRLKGFEERWNQSGKIPVANYTNIPKGNYTLEIRSTNSDGVWVDNTRALAIQILPSFWETPWAYLIYAFAWMLFVFAVVYILFTFYRLRHKVNMEQKMSDLKIRFFTSISHELRTPLTLISAPVRKVLSRNDLTPEARADLLLVDRNTNRMNFLINQLLDFRKIQNHKMKMRVQQTEIIAFTRQVMDCFTALAVERQITFVLQTELTAALLWVDVEKFEKMLFNLIANAFKYTPKGRKIEIVIKENNHDIQINICDEGIGIPEEKQKHLFERFETAITENVFNQASTGIGLSLTKELIELHNGRISLDSQPGQGSVFTLTLKKGKTHFDPSTEFLQEDNEVAYVYNVDTVSALGISAKELKEPLATNNEAEKRTLLIVEDNEDLRLFLRSIFESDFFVIEAEDGEKALALAQLHVPELIISDVMMPVKDGIEMLSELRADVGISHIPVILLTSRSTVENRIEGIELGADDYITKPFDANYLHARVLNLLTQRGKLQQYYRSLLPADTSTAEPLTKTIPSNSQLFMARLLKAIEKHIGNGNLKVEDLAQEIGMGRNLFFKKIKSLTGLSPVEFLRDIRLNRAAEIIKTTDLTISQVAYEVGFNDAHYFSKCFKMKFGVTPTEYRE
ncbi:hybrid sensor histidine kinase/response regulator [Bacteroides sp. 214]|nr:hybrid sensor histidine kinase/response regulator [Bacteroides sp. 214]